MARVVVVFDFDKTLIDCDSDNWVVEQLGVDDTFLHLLPTLPWNSLMDQMMIEIHSRKKTIQDIAECLRQGIVMDRIRASVSAEGGKKRFIYVGDGSPDFCATLKLKEEEFVMPRKDFPLWEFICSNKNLIKAKILEWSDGEELGTRLLSLINTILIEEKCSVRTDLVVVPVDCKFQTGSISSHDSYTRDVLQVPR
ncbi:conserved hypothetical protein [Ricinus communis]|uniref:Uncharacterized protein n=1 Tax=Ricinus communis TaxID=3988 RepID=B9RRU0_RICCO|nr:conserved hypothetical protein [Ricinus communis]